MLTILWLIFTTSVGAWLGYTDHVVLCAFIGLIGGIYIRFSIFSESALDIDFDDFGAGSDD